MERRDAFIESREHFPTARGNLTLRGRNLRKVKRVWKLKLPDAAGALAAPPEVKEGETGNQRYEYIRYLQAGIDFCLGSVAPRRKRRVIKNKIKPVSSDNSESRVEIPPHRIIRCTIPACRRADSCFGLNLDNTASSFAGGSFLSNKITTNFQW